jgi:protein-glutamine gamma-glutamyltransferase
MVGIPTRVVAGFAPGLPDPDEEGTYTIRDTDAHSWLEVWFPRVGWVTVDPTPSAAPARTETFRGSDAPGTVDSFGAGRAFAIEESAQSGRINDALIPSGDEDEGGFPARGLVSLVVIAGIVALVLLYQRRRRRLISPEGAEPQLRELVRALPLVGYEAKSGTTLLGIERAFAGTAGPEAARYPAALRANRYGRRNPRRPDPRDRRMLRRALGRGRGPVGWFRALLAIPPGGPRG